MKTLGNILLLGFAIILFTTSCSNEDTHQLSSGDINATEALRLTRVGQAESMEATFGGQKVTIEASDMISMQTMSAEDGDAQAVLNINQALMGTEKEAQLLDVKFSMADSYKKSMSGSNPYSGIQVEQFIVILMSLSRPCV